ncbi:MAG TPA: hypothetical protein VF783_21165 [Terriglobales bacterium]
MLYRPAGAGVRPASFGSAHSAGGVPGQDSLLELLDLGELPPSHLFDHPLNGGNDRLANLYEFDARNGSAAAWEEECRLLCGIPVGRGQPLAPGTEGNDARC